MEKFKEEVDKYVLNEECKLKRKYGVNNAFTLYFMIAFYKKVERRGFRIKDTINKEELTEKTLLIDKFY